MDILKLEEFLIEQCLERIEKAGHCVAEEEQAMQIYKKLVKMLPSDGIELLNEFEELKTTREVEMSIVHYKAGLEDSRKLIGYMNGTYK